MGQGLCHIGSSIPQPEMAGFSGTFVLAGLFFAGFLYKNWCPCNIVGGRGQ